MRDPAQKQFMKNYYAMAVSFMIFALAVKLGGYVAAFCALMAMGIANPAIRIPVNRYRWLAFALLLSVSLYAMPPLEGLRPDNPVAASR